MKGKTLAALITVVVVLVLVIVMASGGSTSLRVSVEDEAPASESLPSNLTLKVYLENSGSMDGYMCDGSDLKDAIFDYVSSLNRMSKTTELYYINSKDILYDGSLNSYIKTLNPAGFRAAGGNRSNSDLSEMLGRVLTQVSDTSVCVFVSDCILDLPVQDSQKFLNNCQISVKNSLNECRQRVPDLAVEVVKLRSTFTGTYYYPDGRKEENLHDVERPYYMWIFGTATNLSLLQRREPLSQLERYKLEGYVSFTAEVPVAYEVRNRFLKGDVVQCENGRYTMMLRADFSTTLQPEDVIETIDNYSFRNSGLEIESISPATNAGSYTHVIKFSMAEGINISGDVLLLNAPELPSWVEESNDVSDTNIMDRLNTTAGILNLIQGVKDSYKNDQVITKCKFKISKHK